MRWFVLSLIAGLAAIALFPVVMKGGKKLREYFSAAVDEHEEDPGDHPDKPE